MYQQIVKTLLNSSLISPGDADRVETFEESRPFSLHWELKAMLYFGVLLINAGIGYLIYENIDSIGHLALIFAIGAVSAGCFWYAWRHRAPFSPEAVKSPTPYYDYILLLGCLTFLVMEGYWQYQYQIFGTRYGLATLIPMVLFFTLAYLFDNRGVLALGITALATWVGITITPYELLRSNDFASELIVLTGLALAVFLCLVSYLGARLNVKKHFALTYLNFGIHLMMIACLAGMIALDKEILFFPLLCAATVFFLWYARENESFYFLTVALIYAYIGFTWFIFKYLRDLDITTYLFYFVASCAGIIVFLVNHKKFFKTRKP